MPQVILIDDRRAGPSWCEALAAHPGVVVTAAPGEVGAARRALGGDGYDVVILNPRAARGEALDLVSVVRRDARLVWLLAADDGWLPVARAAGIETLPLVPGEEDLEAPIERWRERRGPRPGPLVPVKSGSVLRLLPVAEIRLVAACDNYTQVSLAGRTRVLVRRTMQQWARLLPGPQFARAHRGLFLNLAMVGRVERTAAQSTRLHFAEGGLAPVEVKRRHWPALRARLEAWRALGWAGGAAGPSESSIAVLAFANLSEAADERFCDGVSEELITVLSKIPGLRVAARTSAFFFKGKAAPVPEIARRLGVDFVVEGSVRRGGRRVRITAQLIRGRDGFHVWSGNFDREPIDILAVQDEIAREIATQLHLELREGDRPRAPVDPQAHWLVLEGRHFWSLRTNDGFVRAEAAFAKALDLDPRFAAAHAGLADVCNVRALYRLADGEREVADDLARARSEARLALRLNPTLAEAHATLGFVAFHAGGFAEAEREFRRAFTLNPNYATGYQFYAWTLCAQGRLDRALAAYAQAIARDPLSFINIDRHAAMLVLAGQFTAALEANERAAALRPDRFVGNLSQRAPILFALGRRDEAVALAREVRRLARGTPFRRNSDADAVFVLQQAGWAREAEEYAAEIAAPLRPDNYLRGFLLAALGRHEEARPALERVPTIMLPQLYLSPMWDGVRESAWFGALLATLGRTAECRLAHETRAQLLAAGAAPGGGPAEGRAAGGRRE